MSEQGLRGRSHPHLKPYKPPCGGLTAVTLRSKVLSAILYIKVCNTLRYRKGVEHAWQAYSFTNAKERQSRQISSKLQDTHNKLSVTQKALRDANKQLAAVSQQLQQQKAELHDISISVKKQKRKLNKLREYTNDVRSDLESLLANRDSVDKNELQRIEAEFSDVIEDLRQLVHYHDQFDAEQQLSDEQLEDYFSLMDKYGYAGRSDINCYADDREEYEASYDYSAYDDEDLEL